MRGEVQLAVLPPPIACPVAHQVGTPDSRHQEARRADAILAQLPAGQRDQADLMWGAGQQQGPQQRS